MRAARLGLIAAAAIYCGLVVRAGTPRQIEGAVLLPDGRPAAGAEVLVASPETPVSLREGRPHSRIAFEWTAEDFAKRKKDPKYRPPLPAPVPKNLTDVNGRFK